MAWGIGAWKICPPCGHANFSQVYLAGQDAKGRHQMPSSALRIAFSIDNDLVSRRAFRACLNGIFARTKMERLCTCQDKALMAGSKKTLDKLLLSSARLFASSLLVVSIAQASSGSIMKLLALRLCIV